MSGTRDAGAMFAGQCRRTGTGRDRVASIQSKSMMREAGSADLRQRGLDRDGCRDDGSEQHGADAPPRHVGGHVFRRGTCRSGSNTP